MEGVGMVATNSANSANSDAANSSNFDKSERDSSTISESSNSSSGGKLDSNEKNSSNKVLDTKDINYDVVGNRNSINHISNTFGSHTISTIDNNNTAIDDGNSDSNDVIPPMKITDSCLSVKPNTGTGTDSIGMEDDGSSQMKKKKEVRFADDTNPPPLDTVALSITNYKCIDKKYINYTIKLFYSGVGWTITKRYRNFLDLHDRLKAEIEKYNYDIQLPKLPKKRWFEKQRWLNRNDPIYVRDRKRALQEYLRQLLKTPILKARSAALHSFLNLRTLLSVDRTYGGIEPTQLISEYFHDNNCSTDTYSGMENNGSISAQSSIDIPMEKDNFQDGRDVWNSKLSNEQFVKLFGTAAATNVDEESDYDGRNDSRASSVNSTGSGITGKLATGGTGILSSLISGTSNAVSKGVNAVVGSASIADISDQTNELNINKSNGSDRIDGKRLRDSMYTIRSKYSKAIRSHSKSDYPDGNHNDNFEGSTNDRANSRNNSTDKKSNGNFPLSYDPDLEKLPTFAHVDSFQVKETFSDVLRNSDSSDDEVDSSSDEEENYERKSNDFVNNFTLHEEVTTMPDMESLNIIDGIRHRTSSN